MCRLMGYVGREPAKLEKEILELPNSILNQSVCDKDACKPNDDGWGFGYENDGQLAVTKQASAPRHDPAFRQNAGRSYRRMLLHIRRASVGNRSQNNTHPWLLGKSLIFAHNGSIYGFDKVRNEAMAWLKPELRANVTGETDSEYAMMRFVQHLSESASPDSDKPEAFRGALSKTIADCRALTRSAGESQPPKLNFMLLTRHWLVATRAVHSLGYYPDRKDGVLITSEPLSENDGWQAMNEDTILIAGRDGSLKIYDL